MVAVTVRYTFVNPGARGDARAGTPGALVIDVDLSNIVFHPFRHHRLLAYVKRMMLEGRPGAEILGEVMRLPGIHVGEARIDGERF